MLIATINMDAVIHSAIFLGFAGVGAMMAYQGVVLIWQAKNKFQAFRWVHCRYRWHLRVFLRAMERIPAQPERGRTSCQYGGQ